MAPQQRELKNGILLRNAFEKYFTPLCFFAEKKLGSNINAEDIVVEAFERLWKKPEILENITNPEGIKYYLYKSVINLCMNARRDEQRRRNREKEYMADVQTDANPDHLKLEIMRAELMQAVQQQVKKMPLKRRNIFNLLFNLNLSVKDIAIKMGISSQTVLNVKSAAVKQIKRGFHKK